MYDGTVTREDPNLVETFELDEQTTAYILADNDAELPDWDGIGYVYRVADDHPRYDDIAIAGDGGDSPEPVKTIRTAWDQFNDWDLVARYLRMFHGAMSVDYTSRRDYTALAVVTGEQAAAWGCPGDMTPDLAAQALETYRQWAEGEVYGVIVVNSETGEEESCWGIYDGSPNLDYCHTTAVDIAPIGVAS